VVSRGVDRSRRPGRRLAQSSRRVRDGGFDFTLAMRVLCEDIATRLTAMSHIDVERISIAFAPNRKPVVHGLQASLTPLRFAGGAEVGIYQGRPHRIQQVVDEHGRDSLYVLTFYLPRFMDNEFREKLITVFHELWHISPDFNGDLRRHPGRCYAHSASQANYDLLMSEHVDAWLRARPPQRILEFLRLDFANLQARYGSISGNRIRRPKLIPVAATRKSPKRR